MGSDSSIDRILSPWLYENGATPPETRLQSAAGSGDGHVRLSPEILRVAAGALGMLRGEAEADVKVAIRAGENSFAGPGLQLNEAIAHVHDRWGQKLAHLLSDMEDRAGRLRQAADNWENTERENAKAFTVAEK